MNEKKFDPKKLQKLNNPQRLVDIPPAHICSRLTLEKPDVVVEIGAGTAFFSIAFLRELHPSTLYACDLSETMLDWIRENVTPENPNIIAVKNEESAVPLTDGIADLVFMITLHHELEDPALMLREANRILKPEGQIFVVDWKKQDMPEGPPTSIRCVPQQVENQLRTAGFDDIRIYDDLPKHFLLVGKKHHQSTGRATTASPYVGNP